MGFFGPVPVPGGMSRRVGTHPPIRAPGIPRDTVDKRAVRILLECFFVISCEPISVTLPHDTRLIYSDFCFQRTRRFGY